MPESFNSRLLRWKFNLFPAYRGTGARVTYIADDFREVRIRLPLSLRTRNAVGTIFGGSMYGAADPIYMIMLMRLLGRGFTVWDKAAEIRFRKPGRATLYATFKIGEEELTEIRSATANGPVDRLYSVDLVDSAGVVHATVTKTIYIRRNDPEKSSVQPTNEPRNR
jgi:acyl-coenzyme A thioesterase PaaI-like protein